VSAAQLGVVILTFNSMAVIERTIRAAQRLRGSIVVVDSGSTDETRASASGLGCEVLEHPFVNYSEQRNWAIDRLGDRFEWQLHLDADEVLDEEAIAATLAALGQGRRDRCYLYHRRTHFMGRRLRFGGATNWHMRLFRAGSARCEDRLYDQHFVTTLRTETLRGWLDDFNVGNLAEWIARHNRWSTLEAEEMARPVIAAEGERVSGRLSADPRERRRFYKGVYYRAPRLWRAAALFGYRYVIQLGFLDGRVGFVYAFLWAFWFRAVVDAKLIELESASANRQT
jgi:glycosyltransferase involved in cell wall biosynthesis